MPTVAQMKWLRRQPLAVQLAAVDRQWQERADMVVVVADQMWSAGKKNEALAVLTLFSQEAADAYEGLTRPTAFSRFARERIRDIASGAIQGSGVVMELTLGASDEVPLRSLSSACKRLGFCI